MKRYLIALSLLAIMNTLSEAVASPTAQFSSKCSAGLEGALNTLNIKLNKKMTLDDLKNNRTDALTFKNYFIHTETWGKLISVCAPILNNAVDCATCTNGQCCDPFSGCFWECTNCNS